MDYKCATRGLQAGCRCLREYPVDIVGGGASRCTTEGLARGKDSKFAGKILCCLRAIGRLLLSTAAAELACTGRLQDLGPDRSSKTGNTYMPVIPSFA
jgi:hypothetical protein